MKKGTASLLATSPYKSVAEELTNLRKTFRSICRSYAERLETSIGDVYEKVSSAGTLLDQPEDVPAGSRKASLPTRHGQDSASSSTNQLRDLRDMLNLLRTLDVKPAAGRRKDLKKVESLLDDLRMLSDRW